MTEPTPPAAPSQGARIVRVMEDREGQRIDNFLLGYLKGAPRSLVYKLLRSGQVRVNGGRVKAERRLEAGDEEVEIYQWKRVPGVPDTACGR